MNEQKLEILYEVRAKRDLKMMKAFITFLNRVQHPYVSAYFIFFGAFILFLPLHGKEGHGFIMGTCYVVGAFMVLMGFFRHYIPLMRMRKIDEDYINQVVYTYSFGKKHINVFRGEELLVDAGSYKDITSFYVDEDYYYLGLNNSDLFVLPKNCFTVGTEEEFRKYIQDKAQMTAIFIPTHLVNRVKTFLSTLFVHPQSSSEKD